MLGGSAVSTPQLASALTDAGCSDVHLALIGRSEEKLALVAAACRRLGGTGLTVSEHRSPETALPEADVILSQVRIGGLEGRMFDEQYARDLGIPGEETVGPGGFALAWRTLPALRRLFETCRRLAPEALLLVLTNPASMVHRLAGRYLRAITLCDAPIVLGQKVAALAGADPRTVNLRYVGLNHCGWITALEVDGDDLVPDLLAHPEELGRLTGVDAHVIAETRAIPNPYLRYLYHPDRQLTAQLQQPRVRATELQELEALALSDYGRPDADLAEPAQRRPAPWYSECVVPAVRSLTSKLPLRLIVNTTNDRLIPFLPPQATVEIAAEIAGGEIAPLPRDELPSGARTMLEAVAAFEVLAFDAILSGDREGCVDALTVHPLVPSVDVARELVSRVERRFGPLEAAA